MGDDLLAGPCTGDVGVTNSVGALWQLGGGAWLVCVAICCGYFVGGNLFYLGLFGNAHFAGARPS